MKNQKGNVLIIVGGIVAVFAAVAIFLFMSYVSANNYGAEAESGLKASYANNQNILGQYGQKIAEAAQVPAMFRDDLEKVAKTAMSSRYGEAGSKAMFQMLKEHNPTLDPAVYTKLQQLVESGRNEFQNGQTSMLDKKRAYEANLNYFWRGMWLRVAGFPKVPLDTYKMVTTDAAADAFEKGKETAPIKLR